LTSESGRRAEAGATVYRIALELEIDQKTVKNSGIRSGAHLIIDYPGSPLINHPAQFKSGIRGSWISQ
jgi:hypothetical protein